MSDQFGNHIVGFPTRRLICIFPVIQHMLLVLEMFLLAILASVAYRRSEHRNLTETNLAEVGGEPTFDCRKLGTVATSTGDLHVSNYTCVRV